MAICPHCEEPLEVEVEPDAVTVHEDGETKTIEPDVFTCYACDAVLFATVSRELDGV
ncbi:hypothetical protein [Natronococcus occultus]|uniref:Small CPxCG-related zinc finger protein n=1 Tax=Natronococcus occultus SP4 TaxID=694430 RepID=L0JWF4_9EURY|nr:hypothetical protein [Natronococcus occultus]AGB36193.1 hypothetical protein Natoc_0326 [Natronococcus occultus SP4]